jgi:hypothetical protein
MQWTASYHFSPERSSFIQHEVINASVRPCAMSVYSYRIWPLPSGSGHSRVGSSSDVSGAVGAVFGAWLCASPLNSQAPAAVTVPLTPTNCVAIHFPNSECLMCSLPSSLLCLVLHPYVDYEVIISSLMHACVSMSQCNEIDSSIFHSVTPDCSLRGGGRVRRILSRMVISEY